MDAHHKRVRAMMDAWIEDMRAWRKEMKVDREVMEACLEKTETCKEPISVEIRVQVRASGSP
jgi:hypothetical protein